MHRRLPAAVAVVLLAAAAALGAARWSIEEAGSVHPIDSRTWDGVDYLAADDIAAALGGTIREDRGSGNYVMEVRNLRIVLSGRESLVSAEGKIYGLDHPNRVEEDRPWVGPDFLTKVIAPLYPRAIRRTGRAFVVGDMPPVNVELRTSRDALGTRAVLEFTHAIPFEHEAGPDGVRIRVRDVPLSVTGLPRPIDGDEVRAAWYDESSTALGGTFWFEAGDGYTDGRVSQLSDPFRIVVDFDRAGGPQVADEPWTGRLPGPGTRGIRTIVIDPGHGGSEMGARGPTGLAEKEVVLDIARRVARLLRRSLGVAVVLTRESDQLIALDERAGIANNRGGDLFVSIHANASRGRSASGAETYYLAREASDPASESVAMAENLSHGGGDGGPAGDDLSVVLWDMAQSEFRIESAQLAETVQRELNSLLDTRDRGVKQAPFRVLMGLQMAAVLVEVAFISNPKEETELRTDPFRERIAEAIALGVEEYKRSYEARIGLADRPVTSDGRGGS
ncbi:MAG: N-acetylmuramoyl-L-alanine amidase [Acidobacteriota bacterium]|jgi:N-acetylmuramoyl-L-alanine amidase